METMFLFAGLAIAGVVGLAAAFYFSIRSGSGGAKRLRSARAGRAGTDGTERRPGSRSGGTARSDNARRAANGSRPANTDRAANAPSRNYRAEDSTGPNPVLDFADPALVGGRRGAPGASAGSRTAAGSPRTRTRTGEQAADRFGDRAEPSADAWQADAWQADAGSGESWPGDASAGDPQATDPGLGSGDKTS